MSYYMAATLQVPFDEALRLCPQYRLQLWRSGARAHADPALCARRQHYHIRLHAAGAAPLRDGVTHGSQMTLDCPTFAASTGRLANGYGRDLKQVR